MSDQTVRNRLFEVGLSSYHPLRCPARTAAQRRQGVESSRHILYEEIPWEEILFSGEYRFSLISDCRRQRVHRNARHRTSPQYTQPVGACGGGGILMWAEISLGLRSEHYTF